MEKIILEYYQQMQSIDPNFNWVNKTWWKDNKNAKVIVSGNPKNPNGFCIVGYKHFADYDVKSEICDLYCTNPFSLLALIRASMKHIDYPFGFQILENNKRAVKTFELILNKFNTTFKKTVSKDQGTIVYKYRILSNASKTI